MMAENTNVDSVIVSGEEGANSVPESSLKQKDVTESSTKEGSSERTQNGCDESSDKEDLECSVCLQPCVHPVKLPCNHVFCYLCVKGVANRSKRCALCRSEIPADFVNKPVLLHKEDLLNVSAFDDGSQWFYSGNNSGWWRYDERTSQDLEQKYKEGMKKFEILIAGYLYVIDLDQMVQYRSNDSSRRRQIKRDQLNNVPTKGVAGLKLNEEDDSYERESGDGDGEEEATQASRPTLPTPSTSTDLHNNNRALLLRSALMQISPPITDSPSPSRTVPTNSSPHSLMSQMRDLSLGDNNPRYFIPRRGNDAEARRRRRRERESFTSLTRINTDSSESD